MIVIPHLRTRKGNVNSSATSQSPIHPRFCFWTEVYDKFATDLVIHVSQEVWNEMMEISE